MGGMDFLDTIKYYNKNAADYYEETVDNNMEEIIEKFLEHIPADSAIMDLGCGSGRDSLYFINEGFDVTAVDGSEELCELAQVHIGQDVLNMTFDELEFDDVFDGVWACSSLLHVPKKDIKAILGKVVRSLKKDGVLYMSFRYGEFEGMRDGRYYSDYRLHPLRDMLREIEEIDIIDIFKTESNYNNIQKEWINVFVRKI